MSRAGGGGGGAVGGGGGELHYTRSNAFHFSCNFYEDSGDTSDAGSVCHYHYLCYCHRLIISKTCFYYCYRLTKRY